MTQHATEFGPFTWHKDPRDCAHRPPHTCRVCDFDGYYEEHANG